MSDHEHFSHEDVLHALQQWLQFGEESRGSGHQGYYAQDGWAARVLRFHLQQMLESTEVTTPTFMLRDVRRWRWIERRVDIYGPEWATPEINEAIRWSDGFRFESAIDREIDS